MRRRRSSSNTFLRASLASFLAFLADLNAWCKVVLRAKGTVPQVDDRLLLLPTQVYVVGGRDGHVDRSSRGAFRDVHLCLHFW